MKWVTFRDGDGARAGVLSGGEIHALQLGVSLLELIGSGAAGLQEVGEDALRSAPTVSLGQVTLAAPIPRPPSIRDSLCFLEHMRNCQAAMGGGSKTPGTGFRRSTSPARRLFSGRMTTPRWRPEVLGRISNWRSLRSSE